MAAHTSFLIFGVGLRAKNAVQGLPVPGGVGCLGS